MRAFSSFPLDDDVTEAILTFLPDFDALEWTILISKAVYYVFKTHPNSIIRAVANNVVGPALPQALRLVRAEALELDGSHLLAEENAKNICLNREEAHTLSNNTEVAHALEDLFSRRHKDRTSSTSRLSDVESLRFQRALYRLWLYSSTWGGMRMEDEILDEDEDEDRLAELRDHQDQYLSTFATQELKEIERVYAFLAETVDWVARAQGTNYMIPAISLVLDHALYAGPRQILQVYQDQLLGTIYSFEENNILSSGFAIERLKALLRQRSITVPDEGFSYRIILDQIVGEQDKCHRCNSSQGVELWNETNWVLLKTIMRPSTVASLLKGKLQFNVTESAPLRSYVQQATFCYATFMHELFESRTPAFEDWEKQHWLCTACMFSFIGAHLHLWWLEQKRQAGETILEDCWYGYNCRTQMKLTHAAKRNHLCEPGERDDGH